MWLLLLWQIYDQANRYPYIRRLPLTTYQKPLFAVSPEIVPAPEFHRSVASLISSQSRITFGRSFSCQGTREKISLKGWLLKRRFLYVFSKLFSKSWKFVALHKNALHLVGILKAWKNDFLWNFFIFVKIAQQKKPSHR